MKNIISLVFISLGTLAFGQMIFGDQTKASANQNSVLLDFEKSNNKGILLPTVSALPTTATNGTILLDATTPVDARVKLRQNNTWIDLSTSIGNATSITTTKPTTADNAASKVVVGNQNTSADGVLVLEATDKAMVLPTVNSTDAIISPSPGMMVYVANSSTNIYLLAVYNGTTWAYWAAN